MRQSKEAVSAEGAVAFGLLFIAGTITSAITKQPAWVVAGTLLGVYLLISIKVADQWEKAAVLRFGKFRGMRGPGLFFIIPVVEKISNLRRQKAISIL
jgi:hypothetical protein